MALIEKLENIGDAIRSKTGKTDLLTLDEMATEISNIETGGGSGGDIDWSVIGYDSTPQSILNGYNYAKEIQDNWDNSIENLSSKFSGDIKLIIMPLVDTSNVKNFRSFYYDCSKLLETPKINTSKGTDFNSMYYRCTGLESIPQLDTSNGENLSSMFTYSSNLIMIPLFDTSKCNKISSIFTYCNKITTLGGFLNLGKAYNKTSSNYSYYTLDISMASMLTRESLINVIEKVYDLNLTYNVANGGTLYTQQLKLGSTNLAKLTAEEITIATSKGWSVS